MQTQLWVCAQWLVSIRSQANQEDYVEKGASSPITAPPVRKSPTKPVTCLRRPLGTSPSYTRRLYSEKITFGSACDSNIFHSLHILLRSHANVERHRPKFGMVAGKSVYLLPYAPPRVSCSLVVRELCKRKPGHFERELAGFEKRTGTTRRKSRIVQ
ncbi:hypothetical protein B0H12DRAFT_1109097 [Mycena haematopus]|nr:hypothetical protein B0H12DRAFT_1109097 [Mycena haematopus]